MFEWIAANCRSCDPSAVRKRPVLNGRVVRQHIGYGPGMRIKAPIYWTLASIFSLGLAIGLGTLVRLQFLPWSVLESNPPACFNRYDDRIDCRWDEHSLLIYVSVMALLLALFMTASVLLRRRLSPTV